MMYVTETCVVLDKFDDVLASSVTDVDMVDRQNDVTRLQHVDMMMMMMMT